MIADQHMHPAACRNRLSFEAHQEIHGLARFWPAVQNVTDDDEMCPTRGPDQVFVKHTGIAQCLDQGFVCPVDIAERNDAFDVVEVPLAGRCWRRKHNRSYQQDS